VLSREQEGAVSRARPVFLESNLLERKALNPEIELGLKKSRTRPQARILHETVPKHYLRVRDGFHDI
jgi:hypothetical protein